MTQLQAFIIPVTGFQQNCSLVFDKDQKRGAIVDPGGDIPLILEAIEQSGVTIEKSCSRMVISIMPAVPPNSAIP